MGCKGWAADDPEAKLDNPLYGFAKKLQGLLASLVDLSPLAQDPDPICALDVAYRQGRAIASAVLWSLVERRALSVLTKAFHITLPYIPTLLYLREAPPLLELLDEVKPKPGLIMTDGHGIAHPRRAGLACVVGLLSGTPTIGIAKGLLTGELEPLRRGEWRIILRGEVVGYAFGEGDKPSFYASPGHLMSVEDVRRVITFIGGGYPIPLRMADRECRRRIRELG